MHKYVHAARLGNWSAIYFRWGLTLPLTPLRRFVYIPHMVKNKPPKVHHLTTRVEPKIRRDVEEVAIKERRTLSQMVSVLILEALEARNSKEQAA